MYSDGPNSELLGLESAVHVTKCLHAFYFDQFCRVSLQYTNIVFFAVLSSICRLGVFQIRMMLATLGPRPHNVASARITASACDALGSGTETNPPTNQQMIVLRDCLCHSISNCFFKGRLNSKNKCPSYQR